jgi:hypothetical protein
LQQQQEEDSLSDSVSGGLSEEYNPIKVSETIKIKMVWTMADFFRLKAIHPSCSAFP